MRISEINVLNHLNYCTFVKWKKIRNFHLIMKVNKLDVPKKY
jgi:hypothetical protein